MTFRWVHSILSSVLPCPLDIPMRIKEATPLDASLFLGFYTGSPFNFFPSNETVIKCYSVHHPWHGDLQGRELMTISFCQKTFKIYSKQTVTVLPEPYWFMSGASEPSKQYALKNAHGIHTELHSSYIASLWLVFAECFKIVVNLPPAFRHRVGTL